MKKFILFFSFITVLFTSCNSDDNNDSVNNLNNVDITGKWYLSKTKDSGETEWQENESMGPCGQDYVFFTTNEMINYYHFLFNDVCQVENHSEFYSRDGRFLNFNEGLVVEILNVGNNMMHLKGTFNDQGVVSESEAIFVR